MSREEAGLDQEQGQEGQKLGRARAEVEGRVDIASYGEARTHLEKVNLFLSCIGVTEAQAEIMKDYVCDVCRQKDQSELYCFCRTPYDNSL